MTILDSLIAAEIAKEEETEAREERRANLVPSERLEELRRNHVFGGSPQIKPARLEDLRGMLKVRENVARIIAFFKNHRDFARRGARIQPGVLLDGPGS
jgi:hypothetical protein